MVGKHVKYFDNPLLSDVTLRFGDNSIKAHKIILSEGTEYFRRAFEPGFIESAGNEMILEEDDSAALRGVIAHLYGRSFDGNSTYVNEQGKYTPEENNSTIDLTAHALYLVKLYVTADKYEVLDLKRTLYDSFRGTITLLLRSAQQSDNLEQVAKLVYVDHSENVRELMESMVTAILVLLWHQRSKKMIKDKRFQEAMIAVPELCFDVVVGLKEYRDLRFELDM